MTNSKKISQAEFAKKMGCSRANISKLIRDGILILHGNKLDEVEATAAYKIRPGTKTTEAVIENNNYGVIYQKARASKEIKNAQNAGVKHERDLLKLGEEKKELVRKKHVEGDFVSMFIASRARLNSMPSKVALECVGKSYQQITEILEREVGDILEDIRKWGVNKIKELEGE